MRLRALHLGNVRKFAGQRASITGIGDGITVVSEANEFGKSTFFDALHALFFEKYSSAAKPVKNLQPYARGAVEVAAEIETDAGHFRVEKTFLKGSGSARVLRLPGEAVVAQDDEAERWLLDLLGSDKNGPAGLLWVRQGVTDLAVDSKVDGARQLDERRDLLSSVSGEIDAMTGGRRMDRVMKRVAEELKGLVTATGKPTGAWRTLNTDIAGMKEDLAALTAQIDRLSGALAARRQVEAQLAHLDQEEARAIRGAALAKAEVDFANAKAHAGQVDRAAQTHRLAEIEAQAARDKLDVFLAAVERLTTAQAAVTQAQDVLRDAMRETGQRDSMLTQMRATRSEAQQAVSQARADQEAARKQAEARAARVRADDLKNWLQQIEDAQKTRDAAHAKVAASSATPEWLRRVEEAQSDVAAQTATLAAHAATLRMTYDGEARALRDGSPLPGGQDLALHGAVELTLPGIGTLSLQVPEVSDTDLTRAMSTRDDLLATAAASDIQDARDLTAQRAVAEQERDTADAILTTLAPGGPDGLRAQMAAAELAAGEVNDTPLPEPEALTKTLDRAQAADIEAQATLTVAETAATQAREAAIRAQAAADAAQQALDMARAAAGAEDTREAVKTELIRANAVAADALKTTATALATLREKAPDMVTAEAEVTRARTAIRAADEQTQKARIRVAELSAEIRALSEAGIEETRDTLAGELDTARARAARFAAKAAALQRLQAALDAERTAARDTYFGPVQAELKPLLSILYDDAGLQFDSDSLLPAGLTRAETEETLDRLSGGTQEQIAILTRLAFARLFKRQGRHMPIVLDDALVYSDDGRIVRMFTALTRVAQDQQILVFTCRTMAFLSLGGTRPEVTIRDL
ncbi:AAA family ATPase [Jannaschia sp. CCS1]|uniref:AAA family ATPase n=1 Tax=Jannaschia sp. (strain CCS1) TaxID=290400 RepID=UPI000053A886|nr:AAA family ATPase [Jannaschia sp. CCS1]ABD55489.1 hypothetical protein Jann_2572 [Jannaschia sp. CCS1]